MDWLAGIESAFSCDVPFLLLLLVAVEIPSCYYVLRYSNTAMNSNEADVPLSFRAANRPQKTISLFL